MAYEKIIFGIPMPTYLPREFWGIEPLYLLGLYKGSIFILPRRQYRSVGQPPD